MSASETKAIGVTGIQNIQELWDKVALPLDVHYWKKKCCINSSHTYWKLGAARRRMKMHTLSQGLILWAIEEIYAQRYNPNRLAMPGSSTYARKSREMHSRMEEIHLHLCSPPTYRHRHKHTLAKFSWNVAPRGGWRCLGTTRGLKLHGDGVRSQFPLTL
jgi:hypothetical protein